MNLLACMGLMLLLPGAGESMEVLRLQAGPGVQVFLADATADGRADLVTLEGNRLNVQSLVGPFKRTCELPADTVAFDFLSWPSRAEEAVPYAELVLVGGGAVWRMVLPAEEESSAEPERLFEADTLLEPGEPAPSPVPLVVPDANPPLLALPMNEGVEWRRLSGERVASQDYDADEHSLADLRVEAHPGGQAWNLGAERLAAYPIEPEMDLTRAATLPLARPGSSTQRTASKPSEPGTWPWFALGDARTGTGLRAYFRTEQGEQPMSVVRVRRRNTDGAEAFGPERRYPGLPIVTSDAAPDFDGDGWTDLALWRAKRPTSAFTQAPRLLVDPRWPVYLQGHRFDSEAQRFDPEPLFRMEFMAPVARFLSATPFGPFERLMLANLMGNGRTGMLVMTDDTHLELYPELGETEEAMEPMRLDFAQPIDSATLLGPLQDDGGQVLLLRTAQECIILHAPVSADF